MKIMLAFQKIKGLISATIILIMNETRQLTEERHTREQKEIDEFLPIQFL